MLRPQSCRWFELVTTRDATARVLATLARSGSVELQARPGPAVPAGGTPGTRWVVPGVEAGIGRFRELARQYRPHWPRPDANLATVSDAAAMLATRLAALDAWRRDADPLLAERERLLALGRTLDDCARLVAGGAPLPNDLGLLATADAARVGIALHVLAAAPDGAALPDLPDGVLAAVLGGDGARGVLLVGAPDALANAEARLAAAKARRVAWPADLRGTPADVARDVQARRGEVGRRIDALESRLHELETAHALGAVLADIELVAWLAGHGGELDAGDRLVQVTGWTLVRDVQALTAPLAAAGLPAVARFGAPPAGVEPPALLRNPRWIRAFEAFPRLLGQPAATEVDPSPLLALIAPLLFGFMFGDVGQGAVLMAVGWWGRRRWPALALLVPGGALAVVFGLLYGSVFAREDLIPALWLHPLHEPVALLLTAIGLGAAILLVGMALSALQALWRGRFADWLRGDAALVLAYVGAGAALLWPPAAWSLVLALAWSTLAPALAGDDPLAGRTAARLAAAGRGLARFVEHLLQLLVNTVSFARVGAFALAHAGLSAAVVGIAEAGGTLAAVPLLVLGNLLILALEGLVVSIQTTRLLLFEFFVRFLEGRGRVFRPLPPPFDPPPPGASATVVAAPGLSRAHRA